MLILLEALRRGAWGPHSHVPTLLLRIIVQLITMCALNPTDPPPNYRTLPWRHRYHSHPRSFLEIAGFTQLVSRLRHFHTITAQQPMYQYHSLTLSGGVKP